MPSQCGNSGRKLGVYRSYPVIVHYIWYCKVLKSSARADQSNPPRFKEFVPLSIERLHCESCDILTGFLLP
jgi:hypothetical protein